MWAVITIVGLAFCLFAVVLLRGAPYLPTLSPQVQTALDLIDLEPGETLLELGCGDGKVLLAAAERGWNVVGYELNPILALVCWLRTRRYRGRVQVICGDFWGRKWPPAEGIFVFLLDRFMPELDKKVMQYAQENSKSVTLVSFAFKIPDKKPKAEKSGLFVYEYK